MNRWIHQVFDPIHASDHMMEEVLRKIETKRNASGFRTRALLIAAVIFCLLTITAFAADYVLNHRQAFFFDTLQALAAKQLAEHPGAAVSCAIPCSAQEGEELETSAEYVARAMERGLLEKEQVLAEGSCAGEANGAERWVIRESQDLRYGDVVTEYRTSPAYAGGLSVEGLLEWDLSDLTRTMSPEKDGQIVVVCRNRQEHELLWVKAHMGYITQEGKRFSLSYCYDITWDYGQPTYILNDAYDSAELFVTDDRIETLLLSYDGQVWVRAAHGHRSVDLYTTGYTVQEMKELLNRLSLAQVLGGEDLPS